MPITRTPIVDDDGSGTTGTVFENAWKQEFYDQIDAFVPAVVAAPPGNVAIGGVLQVNGAMALAGAISIVVPGGSYNNFAPSGGAGKTVWSFNHTGLLTLTGIDTAAEPVGAVHLLVNQTGYTITFKNASPSSVAANQFIGPGYADLVLGSWGSIWIRRAEVGCWLLLKA